jgi:putative ABC transport system permease protein
MYILKNAITSITRNKGRNILLGIILLVIGCATTVTLAIRNTANDLISSYANKFDIEASITVNRENMRNNLTPPEEGEDKSQEDKMSDLNENFNEASNITIEDIESYADSKYVSSYYYTRTLSINSSNIEKASSSMENRQGKDDKGFDNKMSETTEGDFSLVGYNSLEAMTDFINGSYTITSGEISTEFDSYNCVINSELATLNSLEVGDTITLENPNNTSLTYELTITGIYDDNDSDNNTGMSMFSNSVNTIITNTKVIEDISNADDSLNVTNTPTFILTSKDVIEDFTSEVEEKGLSDFLTITTNLETIAESTSNISNLKSYATTFLVITMIIGTIILLVLNAINIRERKYEIGVLRTIGMKKSILTCQFALELLIVTLVSLTVGAVVGSTISVPLSNKLLSSEIQTSEEQMQDIGKNFGMGDDNNPFEKNKTSGVAQVQAYDSINAVVDIKVLGELLGIGIILTLVSSISSMISIQKFSPLQILKERS